jgi:hypothetical protein
MFIYVSVCLILKVEEIWYFFGLIRNIFYKRLALLPLKEEEPLSAPPSDGAA